MTISPPISVNIANVVLVLDVVQVRCPGELQGGGGKVHTKFQEKSPSPLRSRRQVPLPCESYFH
jgi:hypothetical protein